MELVPGVGLEPTRVFTQRILSPLRLPVSSPRRDPTRPIICTCDEDLKPGQNHPFGIEIFRFENHSLVLTLRAILLPRNEACKHIFRCQGRCHRACGLRENAEIPLHEKLQ